jgi:hypothetical protein
MSNEEIDFMFQRQRRWYEENLWNIRHCWQLGNSQGQRPTFIAGSSKDTAIQISDDEDRTSTTEINPVSVASCPSGQSASVRQGITTPKANTFVTTTTSVTPEAPTVILDETQSACVPDSAQSSLCVNAPTTQASPKREKKLRKLFDVDSKLLAIYNAKKSYIMQMHGLPEGKVDWVVKLELETEYKRREERRVEAINTGVSSMPPCTGKRKRTGSTNNTIAEARKRKGSISGGMEASRFRVGSMAEVAEAQKVCTGKGKGKMSKNDSREVLEESVMTAGYVNRTKASNAEDDRKGKRSRISLDSACSERPDDVETVTGRGSKCQNTEEPTPTNNEEIDNFIRRLKQEEEEQHSAQQRIQKNPLEDQVIDFGSGPSGTFSDTNEFEDLSGKGVDHNTTIHNGDDDYGENGENGQAEMIFNNILDDRELEELMLAELSKNDDAA